MKAIGKSKKLQRMGKRNKILAAARSYIIPILLLVLFLGDHLESLAQSDTGSSKAERIAQKVLEASGGKDTWEKSRYFHWHFFGTRHLWWDKKEHRVRVEMPGRNTILVADLKAMKGKGWKAGKALMDSVGSKKLAQMARRIWINDSYWLFMPFKMLDPGVELAYLGMDSLESGPAHKLRMTFDGVGVTPQNKYHVWVDPKSYLVRKWAYFPGRDGEQPEMLTPWNGYKEYNGLFLSSDRGGRSIGDIKVLDEMPEELFTQKELEEKP